MSAAIVTLPLDKNGDALIAVPQQGFLTNIEAVTQLLQTRLQLYVGEWWAAKTDGLWPPLVGGVTTPAQKALLIQQRILATPYVTGISNMDYGYTTSTRQFTFSCTVETQFGQIQLTNAPSVPSQVLPT